MAFGHLYICFSVYHQRDYIAQILVRSRFALEPLCLLFLDQIWTTFREYDNGYISTNKSIKNDYNIIILYFRILFSFFYLFLTIANPINIK